MKTFFEEYGLSVILGCVICLVVVMCSPVGTVIKGGLTDSTEGVKNTGTEVQAKAAKSVKSLAGEEEEVPDTIFVGYNSQNQCLVFSHDENSSGYSACDNKYGDISKDAPGYARVKWASVKGNITNVNIENKIIPSNTQSWFNGCYNLESANLSNIDTSGATNLSFMFDSCSKLTSLDLSSWNTANVDDMGNMFANCSKLKNVNLSSFDTTNVTNLGHMFQACSELTSVNLSSFRTPKLITLGWMFSSCTKLSSIDLSEFDTSNVSSMDGMFMNCSSLTNINLSDCDASSASYTNSMFKNCSNITNINLPNFHSSNRLSNMKEMFNGCAKLTSLDLSSLNTSNVSNMNLLFGYCRQLSSINYGNNFVKKSGCDTNNMFYNCYANKPSWW